MFKLVKLGQVFLAGLLLLANAWAGDVTTSAGILLQKHMSVRAAGMAGAQAALAVDAAAAHDSNPAGLVSLAWPRASGMCANGLVDDRMGSVSVDFPWQGWSWGSNFVYYDGGEMELTNISRRVRAQQDMLFSATAGREFAIMGQQVGGGVTVKYFNSTLADLYRAWGVAADAGFRLPMNSVAQGLALGCVVKNLGTRIKYLETTENFPAYGLLGVGYGLQLNPQTEIQLAGDCQYDFDRAWRGSLGLETRWFQVLALRGGYRLGYDLGAINLGLGLNWKNISLEYALTLMSIMNSMHHLSVSYSFAPAASSPPANALVLTPLSALTPEKSPSETEEPEMVLPEIAVTPEVSKNIFSLQVAEIRRMGNVAKQVVLRAGSQQGVRVSYTGKLKTNLGEVVAGFVVRQTDAELSLADVTGLARDIPAEVMAEIEIPASEK